MESILERRCIAIPEKVRIGPHVYTVKMDSGIRARGAFGEMYGSVLEIVIDKHVHLSRQESTFIHEVLEAINFDWKVGLKHNQLELLELALYQFIQDNPEVFEGEVIPCSG